MDNKEINIFDLFMIVLNKWWVVVCFVFVFAITSFFYTKNCVTPVYTSVGSLYISADENRTYGGNYESMLYAQELVKNYIEILTSNTFFKSVSAESGLDYNFKQISKMISVSSKDDTGVLVVKCTNPSPEESAILVETVLNNAQSEVARVISGGKVSIIDHPEIPTGHSSPNITRTVILSAIIGAILGAALLIIIDFIDDRIKDSGSLGERFDLPVLAEFPVIEDDENEKKPKKK